MKTSFQIITKCCAPNCKGHRVRKIYVEKSSLPKDKHMPMPDWCKEELVKMRGVDAPITVLLGRHQQKILDKKKDIDQEWEKMKSFLDERYGSKEIDVRMKQAGDRE